MMLVQVALGTRSVGGESSPVDTAKASGGSLTLVERKSQPLCDMFHASFPFDPPNAARHGPPPTRIPSVQVKPQAGGGHVDGIVSRVRPPPRGERAAQSVAAGRMRSIATRGARVGLSGKMFHPVNTTMRSFSGSTISRCPPKPKPLHTTCLAPLP